MRLSGVAFALVVCCLSSGVASAVNFSFTGTFVQDDQLDIFLFTAPSAHVILRTWGYAGETNISGQVILKGTNGNGVDVCPTNAPNCVSVDPASTAADDSFLALTALNPGGIYALVLSQAGNTPNGSTYGAGFSKVGQGNYTADTPTNTGNGCFTGLPFCAGFLDQRNGGWAVDITGVGNALVTGVPEPGSILLLATGISGLALLRRRRQQT